VSDARRKLPGVDRLLGGRSLKALIEGGVPRSLVVRAIQDIQTELRDAYKRGDSVPSEAADPAWYVPRVRQRIARALRPSLRPLVNATGVVLHTNLGRAPLSEAALRAVLAAAAGYSNLELDVEQGTRGSRYDHCGGLLQELTGAEAALVVNNNAAAVVLALNTLAPGRDAVISRGELVEIGGAFRVPEIMAASGARMVEVGATNRTHAADYEKVLGPDTGAILKVHRSNFRMTGFTAEVGLGELVRLGEAHGVPVLHDLGSGLLIDPGQLGLPPEEPTAGDSLRAGAAVVTLSGDKLLGGPQAGIILGRRELVTRMRANPLCRALRVDKLTLAALEATLAAYRDPESAKATLPTLRMLSLKERTIAERADQLGRRLREAGIETSLQSGSSAVGGGAFPETPLPTCLLLVEVANLAPDALAARLREHEPAVIARIVDDRVALDLRTVAPEQEQILIDALGWALGTAQLAVPTARNAAPQGG
jgi:L-seryl-tRNA(Ser) seleniumtransferase